MWTYTSVIKKLVAYREEDQCHWLVHTFWWQCSYNADCNIEPHFPLVLPPIKKNTFRMLESCRGPFDIDSIINSCVMVSGSNTACCESNYQKCTCDFWGIWNVHLCVHCVNLELCGCRYCHQVFRVQLLSPGWLCWLVWQRHPTSGQLSWWGNKVPQGGTGRWVFEFHCFLTGVWLKIKFSCYVFIVSFCKLSTTNRSECFISWIKLKFLCLCLVDVAYF